VNRTAPEEAAPPPGPRAVVLADLAGELLADVERRKQAKADGKPLGPISGFKRLDAMLAGAFAPGLHILHGSPGVGKTAFALGLALECQCAALFVTCEVSALELLRRMVARTSGLYLGRLKNGDPFLQDLPAHIGATLKAAAHLTILDASAAPATLADLAAAANLARSNPEASGADLLIVVDSIHTWANAQPEGEAEEYDRLTRALDSLDRFARAANAPLIGIAERNRASRSGGQAASAGTRRFEYAAESMIELDAVNGDTEEPSGWRRVKLTVSKNRHGECGSVPLLWHGAMQRHKEGTD
jgi:replicative DNA helicase